jgi:hypothetical protein
MDKHEHKEELHARIIERQAALERTAKALVNDAHTAKGEQCRAVEGALAQLAFHLTSGWAKVGEMEAAELGRWLESTRLLVQNEPPKNAA